MTSPLHLRCGAPHGCLHQMQPHTIKDRCPNWSYVGFAVHRLDPGETLGQETGDQEHLLVILTGKMRLRAQTDAGAEDLGALGARMDLFARQPAHGAYIPAGAAWQLEATTALEVAVCMAPGKPGRPVQRLAPQDAPMEARGKGANTRYVNAIAMEQMDIAESLLVTEVWTPQGNWSSYPPHKHDTDQFPEETYLEETYYHRLNPPQGYGYQRIYNDDLSLDENIAFADRDLVLVPSGYHPCAAPYGYELYYLNVMAGPRRNWRFTNDPAHEWLFLRDGGVKSK